MSCMMDIGCAVENIIVTCGQEPVLTYIVAYVGKPEGAGRRRDIQH